MPILADAYSDAHLNLDTLDRDITEAVKKVETAAQRFEQSLNIKVGLDTTEASAKLQDLALEARRAKEAIEATTASVKLTVDSEEALAELERFKAQLSDETVAVDLSFDQAQAETEIGKVNALLDAIDKNIVINLEANADFTDALAALAALREQKEAIDGPINIGVDLETEGVLDDLAALEALKSEIEREVNIGVDIDTSDALDELAALEALKVELGRDVTVNVDVDTGGAFAAIARLKAALASLKGGGLGSLFGGGGLGGLASLAGPALITAIAGAVAALGPFVTGLIGGAVALLGFGAAAAVAAGGLAAIAIFTSNEIKQTFETLGTDFLVLLRDNLLAPLIDFFNDLVLPNFFRVLTILAVRLAPAIQAFAVILSNSVFTFFEVLANNVGPLLDELTLGIASFIDTFTKFIPSLAPVAAALAGPFFNALNGIIELFLGTAAAAAPAVGALLNGIGDGARGLIEPINRLVTAFTPLLLSLGPGLSNALGQLGPLWDDLGRAVYSAVNLITEVINDLGLQNLIILVGVVAAAFGAWPLAIGAIVVGLGKVTPLIDAIRNGFRALAPAFQKVVEIARTVADAVIGFFSSLFESIDGDRFGAQIQAGLAPVALIAEVLARVLPPVGAALGEILNVLGFLVPALVAFAAVKLVPILGSWARSLWSFGATIVETTKYLIEMIRNIAATKGVSFFTALKQAALGALPAIGAATVALGLLTAALVAGVAVYSAWSSANAKAEQRSKAFADALLTEANALDSASSAYQDALTELDALDEFNNLNLSTRELTQNLATNAGEVERFANVWDDKLGGSGNAVIDFAAQFAGVNIGETFGREFIPETQEQLDAYKQAFAEAGVEIPTVIQDLFQRVVDARERGQEVNIDKVREFINAAQDLDVGGEQAVANLRSITTDVRKELESLGLNQPDIGNLLKPVEDALNAGNIDAVKDLLRELTIQYPELANVTKDAGVNIDDVTTLLEEQEQALAALGIRVGDVYNERLPSASRVLSRFKKALEEGTIATEAFKLAENNVKDSTESVGDAAQKTVARLRQGGSISEFFRIEATEIKNAAEQARKFADAFIEGVTLGGRLSEFTRDEAVEVDRTIYDFLQNLRLQAENARRLSELVGQGFGTLAVQLSSFAQTPETLKAWLDELGSGAYGGFAEANRQIRGGVDQFAASIGTVDPLIRRALNLDEALAEARGDLEDGSSNIFDALDKFADTFRLRITNLQRLNALAGQGFVPLAAQLGQLFSNPEELNAALNQLDAAGTSAKRAANDQFRSLSDLYTQLGEQLNDVVAAAIGFDKAEEQLKKGQVSIQDAINAYGAQILYSLSNARRLAILEAVSPEAKNFAAFLANAFIDDPKALNDRLNEFFSLTPEQQQSQMEQIEVWGKAGADAAAAYDFNLANFIGLGAIPNEESTKAAFTGGEAIANQYIKGVEDTLSNNLAAGVARGTKQGFDAFGAAAAAPGGVPTPPTPPPAPGVTPGTTVPPTTAPPPGTGVAPSNYQTAAAAAAQAFIKGFGDELNKLAGNVVEKVLVDGDTSLIARLSEYARNEPGGQFYDAGFRTAEAFITGYGQGILGASGQLDTDPLTGKNAAEAAIDSAFEALKGKFTALTTDFTEAGLLARKNFSDALFGINGKEGDALPLADTIDAYIKGASLGDAIALAFGDAGTRAANTFVANILAVLQNFLVLEQTVGVLQEGQKASDFGVAFGTSFGQAFNLGAALGIDLGGVFGALSNAAVLLGVSAAFAFRDGFTLGYAIAQTTLAAQVGLGLAALNAGVLQVLAEGGAAAGRALANTMIAGLNDPLTLQQLRTAVFFFVIEVQASLQQVAPNIGREFINGVKTGVDETAPTLLTTIQQIATLIRVTMEQALDINSPSGVGMTIGNQFIQGIAAGLEESTGALTTVAGGVRSALVGALAQPVAIDTTLAGQTGVVGLAAPAAAAVATPGAVATTDTVLLQQMLVELQAQNAELRAAAARPLIGEYNVTTTKEPQSPDQLAQDASFAKALLI